MPSRVKRGDLIAERYELEDELGRGGMAEVWCAKDVRLNRSVAIKFIAPEFSEDPEFLVRFFSEAQSVASLAHPNVVAVLDFGDFDGRPYLVMEYVSGGALSDVVGEPRMPERALEFIEQAARGAGAAHAIGVVHRDLKPANILLDSDGRPKLADFGIASSRGGERITATGQTIGSPHYISPEQVSGQSATPASDVYSLGIVLYQLLTGVRPYEFDNVTAVAISHVDSEPEPPSAHVEDLDPALDALVLRCLAKDPADRYTDGNELAESIATDAYLHENAHLWDDDDDRAERGPGRKLLLGAAAVLLVAGIALAGVLSLGSTDPAPADDETSQEMTENDKKKPRPTPSADVSPAETTTEPSESTEPEDEEPDKPRPGNDGGSGGGGGDPAPDDPVEDPEPDPDPEPEPDPTPEPTEEATPAP